jgi:hypothetical protein
MLGEAAAIVHVAATEELLRRMMDERVADR